MIGVTLGGRWRLDGVIGDGGTSTVYQATDLHLGVRCAVKVLRGGDGPLEQLRARLRAEAETMARLSHPNILRVHAAGSDDGVDWIAMELSDAGSVADRVRAEGPFPPRRAIQVVLQALAALQVAHDNGVVHRDVKPDNLLLQADGTVKLCDFGIALLDDATRLTQSGFAMGSVPYMAPEQRLDAHAVSAAVDVYAAAATLYHLLTAGTPVDLFLAPPSSPRFAGLPEGLVELIRRGTHADPAQRFPSAAAMAEALDRCLPHASEAPMAVKPPSSPVYVATTLPETSRVPTLVGGPVEGDDLELRAERDWLREDAEARRARARRSARLWLVLAVAAVLAVVAAGGTLSVEHWVARESARRAADGVALAGVWKGTLGGSQATLELSGGNDALIGAFVAHRPAGDEAVRVAGAVRDGELVLAEMGGTRLYYGVLSADGRLDGEASGDGSRSPFHLVRVPGPEVQSPGTSEGG